jgi:hypothetical protein
MYLTRSRSRSTNATTPKDPIVTAEAELTPDERNLLEMMAEASARSAEQAFLPPVVRPAPDTRLDQLAAEYASIKPLADEYTARLKTITDGIKTELVALHPDREEILLVGSTVPLPLRLEAVSSWRLDSKTLKKEKPEVWVRFARQSTSWRLSQQKG